MTKTSYHFIGIGGIGMSGLARILVERGEKVSGSDLATSYVTDALSQIGVHIYIGHAVHQVEKESTVIYSTDIRQDNPEFVTAKEMGCQILHRSDLLRQLMKDHKVLAVAGTHGKTTTTAILTHVFTVAKLDPAFAVGGVVHDLKSNSSSGGGEYFIVEADESDGTFLKYAYDGAIITNIDTDHLAHFGTWDALVEAFKHFIGNSRDPRHLFYCADDQTLPTLCTQGISYGFSDKAELKASSLRQEQWKVIFDISFQGRLFSDVEVNLTGKHNALNALAVFGLAYSLGVDEQAIREALASFHGVKRRLEKKGEARDILVLDDYAHHPTEIVVTLKGLRHADGVAL
jgi:UDP-N-acetylmuramate--alanine ligase